MPKTTCNLYDCFLCQHCMIEWRPLIGLNKETRMIKKGKAVFKEGDPVEGIYFMYQGWVKIHKEWTHPKELIVRFAGPGDIIGHRGLGDKKNYPVSATALEDSTVCFVPEEFLETCFTCKPNPDLPADAVLCRGIAESRKKDARPGTYGNKRKNCRCPAGNE